MIELIIGGVIALVAGVVGHWLQRKRNQEERGARRDEIIYEKQLDVFEEAVRTLYFMNLKWIEVVEGNRKMRLLRETKAEGIEAQRERAEALKERITKNDAVLDDFVRIVIESRETTVKIEAYLPLETREAFHRYNSKAVKNIKGVTELVDEEDFKLVKGLLQKEYESAVAILREHMGIKERLQPRK